VRFQREHNWQAVRAACHDLARQTRTRIHKMTGLAMIAPDASTWFSQMFVARLPLESWERIRDAMWPEFKIEVPVFTWEGYAFVRVSVQAYNRPEDMEQLLGAIEEYL
jgi:isopenicillin-N epimerase